MSARVWAAELLELMSREERRALDAARDPSVLREAVGALVTAGLGQEDPRPDVEAIAEELGFMLALARGRE